MTRNKIKAALVICLALFQVACYKDSTTLDVRQISEIEIDFPGIQGEIIHIDKNEQLTIEPVITQTTNDKPLTYEWELNYEVVSTEKDLSLVPTVLGVFPLRLKVSNEDGSAFKTITLRVNSPYETGLIILGEDATGQGSLSFLRKYPDRPIYQASAADFAQNVFAVNNPGMQIGRGPSDIAKRSTQLFIAAADDGKITLINDKTFEVESVITAPEYPDFKPIRINVPDNHATNSPVLVQNGRIFTIATNDHLILNHTTLPADVRFAPKTQYVGGLNFNVNYFWEPEKSRLWNLWYIDTHSKESLAGEELIHFFSANGFCYVVTRDKQNPSEITKTIFGEFIQEYFAEPLDIREQVTFTDANLTLKENSVTVLNDKYFRVIYANGRDIYRWNYSGTDFPTSPYIQLDIPGVVTGMATNPEGTELYVGVYNAAASGAQGSLVVYDIERGTKLGTFEGIADKPVKLYYKQ